MSTGLLSNDDIAKLTADPSPDSRAETAAKIAVGFDCGKLSDKEHGLAKETRDARFTLLIKEGCRSRELPLISVSTKAQSAVNLRVTRVFAVIGFYRRTALRCKEA